MSANALFNPTKQFKLKNTKCPDYKTQKQDTVAFEMLQPVNKLLACLFDYGKF